MSRKKPVEAGGPLDIDPDELPENIDGIVREDEEHGYNQYSDYQQPQIEIGPSPAPERDEEIDIHDEQNTPSSGPIEIDMYNPDESDNNGKSSHKIEIDMK